MSKLIQQNKYSQDCVLVSLINMCHILTGRIITQKSMYYDELAELGGCKCGTCFNREAIADKLGIKLIAELHFFTIDDILILSKDYIIELTVYHKEYHNHSVVVESFNKKTKTTILTNFNKAYLNGKLTFKELEQVMIESPFYTSGRPTIKIYKKIK